MVPKSESLCKKKMNCLGYVLTFRSLLRVFYEGKEEDVERGLCKNPQLSPNEQRELARVVGMDYDKVRKWFQNQRAYAKRK